MTKRIFLGTAVPKAIQESLTVYTRALTSEELRFTKPENYHITVSFFGEQEEGRVSEITNAIAVLAQSIEPFTLSFDGIFFAPPKREPSMIWAQYKQAAPFTKLVSTVEKSVREILPYADKRNGHAPIPHITLARFRQTALEKLPQIQLDDIVVDNLKLYESKRTEAGLTYTVLEEFPLD